MSDCGHDVTNWVPGTWYIVYDYAMFALGGSVAGHHRRNRERLTEMPPRIEKRIQKCSKRRLESVET